MLVILVPNLEKNDNSHKINQVFLMLKLSYIKKGVGLLRTDILDLSFGIWEVEKGSPKKITQLPNHASMHDKLRALKEKFLKEGSTIVLSLFERLYG